MAQKRSPKITTEYVGPAKEIPIVEAFEETENLSIDIPVSVGSRMELALFQLKIEGRKTTKKAYVTSLIASRSWLRPVSRRKKKSYHRESRLDA